jgi:hypothetical protein
MLALAERKRVVARFSSWRLHLSILEIIWLLSFQEESCRRGVALETAGGLARRPGRPLCRAVEPIWGDQVRLLTAAVRSGEPV